MPAWLGWVAVLLLALYLAAYPALAAWGAWAVQTFVAPAKAGAAAGSQAARPNAAPAFAGATPSFILAFAASWALREWLLRSSHDRRDGKEWGSTCMTRRSPYQ